MNSKKTVVSHFRSPQMSDNPLLAQDANVLNRQIEQLLSDPAHQSNPLRLPLAKLFDIEQVHLAQLDRLIKISDGYQLFSRRRQMTLEEQYDRQLRRLEKLARISDHYQSSLRHLSESLKDASLHDPLTGLGNRRFLMDRLTQETDRASRHSTPYVLGILDVDHFKSINDRFGHDEGDKALCAIARAIESALREYDVCGRWGGEEFLILLPQTSMDCALTVAHRVLKSIKQVDLHHAGTGVSASLGLAIYSTNERYGETLNRADAALLQAKSSGRDMVMVA